MANELNDVDYVLDGDQWTNAEDEIGKVTYVSDVVDLSRIKKDAFNIIVSSCGTGKTHFVENDLVNAMKGKIKPKEILFITSRSMIVAQSLVRGKVVKFNPYDISKIREWNGERPINESLDDNEIITMTYDKLIYIFLYCNCIRHRTLSEIKVIVFDECHCLFSDLYIRDINMVKFWIRECLYWNDKIIIGMSATANILYAFSKYWGVEINPINDYPLIRYKAKSLYCTQFEVLPLLFSRQDPDREYSLIDQDEGKTIVMCDTVEDCYKLNEEIPDSVVLVSQNNSKYAEEMTCIRNHLVAYGEFPEETFWNGALINVNVLIATSTMREGINLIKSSGVKNVVCCLPDEMNVTQFLGRCRFDVDKLIVVNEYKPRDKLNIEYLEDRKQEFLDYVYNGNDLRWFDTIKHIVYDYVQKPERFLIDPKSFNIYIQKYWINKKIYTDKDKATLIRVAKACRLFPGVRKNTITFNRVIGYISDTLKLNVVTDKVLCNNKPVTCKIINV